MKHYKIVTPSDRVIVTSDDELVAAIAVLFLGEGRYGLRRVDDDESVLPIFLFGGAEEWLKERGIDDIGTYLREHATQIAVVLESAFYGSASELRALDAALAGQPDDAAAKARRTYNDMRRSSMNNIGTACLAYAERFRQIAAKPKET